MILEEHAKRLVKLFLLVGGLFLFNFGSYAYFLATEEQVSLECENNEEKVFDTCSCDYQCKTAEERENMQQCMVDCNAQ